MERKLGTPSVKERGVIVKIKDRERLRSTVREAARTPQERPRYKTKSETGEQRVQREKSQTLQEQLAFLLKNLDISEKALRDPKTAEELAGAYKKIINEQGKAVVKIDNKLQSAERIAARHTHALKGLQEKKKREGAFVKLVKKLVPAMDFLGRELQEAEQKVEAAHRSAQFQKSKRDKAEQAGREYAETLDALHRAKGIIEELDRLSISAQPTQTIKRKVVSLRGG